MSAATLNLEYDLSTVSGQKISLQSDPSGILILMIDGAAAKLTVQEVTQLRDVFMLLSSAKVRVPDSKA